MKYLILLSLLLFSSFSFAEGDPFSYLENRIATGEKTLHPVPGTEKKITWFDEAHKFPTDFAVLYLHGFSATRQEIAPVPELLAKTFGFNLFATRFTAHGLNNPDAYAKVTSEQWYQDAEDAIDVAKEIGKKTIIMATSTGAILALRLALEYPDQVAALILVSPNFGLHDPSAALLNLIPYPLNYWLLRFAVGKYHHFKPKNPNQAKYWDTKYDSKSLIELMKLVAWVQHQDLSKVATPTLVVYTPKDNVIDADAIPAKFKELGSAQKEIESWNSTDEHVLAGDIVSPNGTEPLRARAEAFLRKVLALQTP